MRPVAELDPSGAVVSRFVYGTRVVAPECMVRGGVTYRLITDQLGSVRLVVNTGDGSIVQRLDYDAFGQVTVDTNPHFQPFGYAGGISDPATGLVRFGVRDYAPDIGRWLSKDPIGFRAGDSNLYAYVGNDPINAIDPTGMFVWELIDVVTFGQDVMAFLGCPGFWTGAAVVVGAVGALPGITAIGRADNVSIAAATVAKPVSKQPNRIYSARELARRAAEPGPYHNFPDSFDSTIFEQGSKSVSPNYFKHAKTGLSNDAVMYSLPGSVNGVDGTYEIGVRPSLTGNTEVVIHRFFRPQ